MPVDFTLDRSTDNYGVMGNPVAHSKSPQIHLAFAAQCGQRLHYQAILVEPSGFARALDEFQRQGGKGLNVTVPFKEDAYRAVSIRTKRADRAGAVNTIWFGEGGESHGDTTDGTGLIRDLRRNGVKLENRLVLILGAGGAVRGVLGDLTGERPQRVVLANRTIERAGELLRRFADTPCDMAVSRFSDLKGSRFDVIVNGTSLSLQGELPPLPDGILA
ncbi:MAG: shikimate dehydrogenase, partial [Gammaproteobacteria bacterium]